MVQDNFVPLDEVAQAHQDDRVVEDEDEVDEEEGEFEQDEGQEEDGESGEAESDEEGEEEDIEQEDNAASNDRGKNIRNLLDDSSDEDLDDDSDDIVDEDDEDDVLKRQMNKKKRVKGDHVHGILRNNSPSMQTGDGQQASLAGLPRKRGRPSKKAKLEQEM